MSVHGKSTEQMPGTGTVGLQSSIFWIAFALIPCAFVVQPAASGMGRIVMCCRLLLSAPQGHSHGHLDSVVKMKSLPFDATQLDIIQFFEAYKLKPNGVQLVVRSDNKPTGEVRSRCWVSKAVVLPATADACPGSWLPEGF